MMSDEFKYYHTYISYMTRYYYNINFPTEALKKRFKKHLFLYRSKTDPDKPIYKILSELMHDTLMIKLEYNSIGIKNEHMKSFMSDWKDKNLKEDKQ